VGTKRAFTDDIHLNVEQVLQLFEQHSVIHEAAPGLETNQQVQIGYFAGVATSNRAENAYVRGPVARGHGKDFVASVEEVRLGDHVFILCCRRAELKRAHANSTGDRIASGQRRETLQVGRDGFIVGSDREKLANKYAGRDFRLTETSGAVAKDILA
jgi:hypothetical protein